MHVKLLLVGVALTILGPISGMAADGGAILEQQCVTCHNLTGPPPKSLKALWARQGPDLFYAGNKYRQEWLEGWLQNPARIRPAGEFYGTAIRSGIKGDIVDPAVLLNHAALSKADATAVAIFLMKLKPHDDLIAHENIEPGTISKQMGEMTFDKFQGCMACHLIESDYGGLSGPELYTAGKRLQPAFMASFIRNPQAWDQKIWMPNKHVSNPNIQKLVHYLVKLSGETGNGK